MTTRRAILTVLVFVGLVTFVVGNSWATDWVPGGPELAPREIGVLLRAYPIIIQGVGVTLWGCDYRVGKAMITITITTEPRDPMPCKRKVAFGKSPQKSTKE